MSNPSKQNGLFGTAESSTEDKDPYQGDISFTDRTIAFFGTTVLLRNVSKFAQYGLKREYVLTIPRLIIAAIAIVILIAADFGATTMIGWVLLLTVIAFAIWERTRPKIYGLTIELNSGTKHYFLNKDENGIQKLYKMVTDAFINREPLDFKAHFTSDQVTIINNNISGNNNNVGSNNNNRGDTFGNVGGNVINHSTNSNAYYNAQTPHGDGVNKALELMGKIVDQSNKNDAREIYAELLKEAQKPAPKKALVKSYWESLVAILPAISATTEIVSNLTGLIN